jgi:hypothetical protein
MRGTKLCNAATLALVGWCFFMPDTGRTIAKDWPSDMPLAFTLEARGFKQCGFSTKDECEKAADQWRRDLYSTADKNGQRVAVPPQPAKCTEQNN